MHAIIDVTADQITPDPTASPTTLGIIGLGPKGLSCLERLLFELKQQDEPVPLKVMIFEAHPFPGAGPVYDPRQPDYLRMNFAARYVDVWDRDRPLSDCPHPSLLDWLAKHETEWARPDAFVPRAIVGRYLRECCHTVLAELHKLVSIEIIPEKVIDLEQRDEQWIISTDSASRGSFHVDQLLLTTGHGAVAGGKNNQGTIPVYPIANHLNSDQLPAGSVVGIRGFALCWLDAAISLTEGRGGYFIKTENELQYSSGEEEVERLIPFSRSGRPMLAKPEKQLAEEFAQSKNLTREHREQLLDECRINPNARTEVIYEHLFACAASLWNDRDVEQSRNRTEDVHALQQWLSDWQQKRKTPTAAEFARRQIRHSVEIAEGHRPLNEGTLLGEAWRQLYPSIVCTFAEKPLETTDWVAFRQLACEMERIAFGPPVVNLRKLLALDEAGKIDWRFLSQTEWEQSPTGFLLRNEQSEIQVDCLIDAVLPGSGRAAPGSLLAQLIQAEECCYQFPEQGIMVNEAGFALQSDGTPHASLAIIGRATEGCVLGNDTLSRRLHSHPGQWAKQLVSLASRSTNNSPR